MGRTFSSDIAKEYAELKNLMGQGKQEIKEEHLDHSKT